MATISTKCPNCGGAMKLKDSLLQCPYCETIFLHIADAKIESEVAVISPAKFAKKIEASKRQFVIKINEKLQVFDIDTKVINKRIQDAKGFLESGEFDKVPGALTGVPTDILAADPLVSC